MITKEEQKAIENRFIMLAEANNMKPTTKAYKNAEVAYFQGAIAVLTLKDSAYPPIWGVCLTSGRSIIKTMKDLRK